MRHVIACGLCAALATSAVAADPGVEEVTLEVGETTSLNVGYLRGIVCDDLSVVRPDIQGENPTSNAVVLKGLKEGSTLCRAGGAGQGAWRVFKVQVLPPKPKAKGHAPEGPRG